MAVACNQELLGICTILQKDLQRDVNTLALRQKAKCQLIQAFLLHHNAWDAVPIFKFDQIWILRLPNLFFYRPRDLEITVGKDE